MHWKLKARVQNAVSMLPSSASYAAYYWMQRRFGGLRNVDPTHRLTSAIEAWKYVQKHGYHPTNKVFLEIGTGRSPIAPIAYWLLGAGKTITIDVNPYLKPELTSASLAYISDNVKAIQSLFGPLLDQGRMNALLSLYGRKPFSMGDLLDLCCITYIAPGDAANTSLASQSVDVHSSFRVFEHIPSGTLERIVEEGNRIVSDNGIFVHRIDYSDHFAHSDSSISKINFLQFSDDNWDKLAGNRYMFMNRLRHDDFLQLFESSGHRLLGAYPDTDERCLDVLQRGALSLDARFEKKSPEILATTGAWLVTRKAANSGDRKQWR